MLDSVQHYCRDIAATAVLPAGIPGPIVARITPPVVEKMSAPRVHVWGGRLAGGRQTAPRGQGMMKLAWVIDVFVSWIDTPDNALENEPFPKIVDAVLKPFITTVMPVWIDEDGKPVGPNAASRTDTQIQAVAESFTGDYPPERSVAGPRMLWYVQQFGINVLEVIQA